MGIFSRLAPETELLAEALRVVGELAQGPTFAHAMTKRMLHREWNMGIDDALDAEAQAQALCMQTEDFRRAWQAFAARKVPKFEGN